MNQALADFSQVIPTVLASGIVDSLCTIYRSTGSYDAAGQINLTTSGFTPLAGHVDIKVMAAPPNIGTVSANESKAAANILERTDFHVWLAGYFPDIKQKDLANIDGNY